MRHISSKEAEAMYQKLLQRYKDEGYVNPKAVLDYNIKEMMKDGLTENEAIFHLCKFPEDGRIEKEEKDQQPPTAEETPEQKKRSEVKRKAAELRKKIEQLTVLFSKSEISEESYKTAVKALEKEMDNLNDHLLPPTMEKPQYEGEGTRSTRSGRYSSSSPTLLWWLVPFFFGILGGIVGYLGVKNDDYDMALNLIVFSVLWTIFLSIVGFFLLF